MAAPTGRCRKLFPLSLLTFFLYSALGCLIPFLNLHCHDLGLTIRESCLVNCSAAIFSIVIVCLAGLAAEKSGRYKTCLVVCIVLSVLAYTGLLVVPRASRSPRSPLMDFDCGEALRMERCANWASCSDAVTSSTSNNTTFTLSGCRYVCRGQRGRRPPPDAAYPLHVCFRSEEGNYCHVQDPSRDWQESEAENTSSSVTFQSKFSLWYADDLPRLPASDFLSHRYPADTLNTLDHVPIEGLEPEDPEPDPSEYVSACRFRPVYPLVVRGKSYDDVFCRPLPTGCSIRCQVALQGSKISTSSCLEVVGDPTLTFWAYLCARSFADACLLSAIALLESATLFSVRDMDGLYGRSRSAAAVGLLLFPPVVGVLIDYYSSLDGRTAVETDYSPAFFLFDGLALIACALVIACRLDAASVGVKGRYVVNSPQRRMYIEQQRASTSSLRGQNKKSTFFSFEMVLFVFLLLVLGSFWGLLETYLHPHYVSVAIGSNKLQIGLTWTLSFACALPFLAVSKDLVRNIGRSHLLVFGFLFYGIRFAGTSFVSNPYWTFPFEAMEALTLSVVWIATVSYGHFLINCPVSGTSISIDVLSQKNGHYRLRMHYLLLLTHFGGGRALGSMSGYFLIDAFGLEWTFRGIALFSGTLGLLYLLMYHTCMRRCRADTKRRHKTPQAPVNGNWMPLIDQQPQQQRPNGDTRIQQQQNRIGQHRQQDAGEDDRDRNNPQEQPILMIDDGPENNNS